MFKKLYTNALCFLFYFIAINYCNKATAQCGVPPTSGSVTISITNNIVNTYYPGIGNPVAGTTTMAVGPVDSRGNATPITAGDLVLIIQVQGADMNTGNTDAYGDNVAGAPASGYMSSNLAAGYYEYNTVSGFVGSVITFSYPLANNYFTRDFTASNSIQRYEVLRIPRYYDLKIKAGASVTCPSWNGQTGGIVAIDVNDIFTLLGSIDVNYKGFRAGGGKNFTGATAGNSNGTGTLTNTDYRWDSPITNAANLTGGAKGEGIVGTPAYYFENGTTLTTTASFEGYVGGSMGSGAPGNAGGGATDGAPTQNQYNSGGGGGGNGGSGGKGGSGYNPAGDPNLYPTGGYGGAAFAQVSTKRFWLGGGGGAGSANNSLPSNEYDCSGGGGGGIVIVRAKQYSGNGNVMANGSNAPGVTDTYTPAQNDGAGGGGAGGTIVMVTTGPGAVGLDNVTASAFGGSGGDMTNYSNHGPGGGGGGGVIISNGTFLSTDVTGGINGLTRSGSPTGPIDNAYGASPGNDGVVITLTNPPIFINAINPGSPCGTLPVTLTDFFATSSNNYTVNLKWKITNVINLKSFELEYSVDGISFSKLTDVKYQSDIADYNYQHVTSSSKNFYRLKMIDNEGGFFYSKILSVQKGGLGNKIVLMYPNPAYRDLTLKLSTAQDEKVSVKIIDNSGKVLLNKIFAVQHGENYLSVDGIDKLPASSYFVKVKSSSINAVEKLVISKN
jgi:Secretion system C-terminal sorting domain